MKLSSPSTLAALCALPLLTTALQAAGPAGPAFYGDPPDAHHPWAIHDRNRPQPPRVEPGTFSSQDQPGKPPSDARILFGGTEAEISKWQADKKPAEPTKWEVKDGALQCVPGSGYIRSVEEFGDCQLHIEWSAPKEVKGDSQGRGNSGVFLMGAVEVQVLDNYNNPTYADGFAGSVYGVNPPMANPLFAPGEWQTYDIIFRRPIVKDGKELDPGSLTVFINGVLVQDHTPLEGGGGHKGRSKPRPFPEKGPLKLQDHGNPVRYRNIWYRPLPARSLEGGTDGKLTEEAATAKRKEIAKGIREDAAKADGQAKTLLLMESLAYEVEAGAATQVKAGADEYVASLKALPADKLEGKKGEVLSFQTALQYLTKANALPADFAAKAEVDALVKSKEWDKKK
ncbi:DUF1080 domain-containing protein [Verrucomicrobium sp. BvORR106]|uniref:3-keto-disaccharide hydrolase n=1 Tax=Verrucomicrobium sp. BvORR106 TaxID=1403819 RepID=UPI00056E7CD2|nr:DUF1080 domain-containing protein [Verrucomicrobium sp. BvORR106]